MTASTGSSTSTATTVTIETTSSSSSSSFSSASATSTSSIDTDITPTSSNSSSSVSSTTSSRTTLTPTICAHPYVDNCYGTCVNVHSDSSNCGGCGNSVCFLRNLSTHSLLFSTSLSTRLISNSPVCKWIPFANTPLLVPIAWKRHLHKRRLHNGCVEHDWFWLFCPLLLYDSPPLFSASIVHRFSCNCTSFQLQWYIVVISLLPPISCIYRGPSAIQNKQSPHT